MPITTEYVQKEWHYAHEQGKRVIPVIIELTGHTEAVTGVMPLADGKVLSWSAKSSGRNPQIGLWDSDGTPIDVLEQGYWHGGNPQIIEAWAKKHGYTLDDLYPAKKEDTDILMAGGRVKWDEYSADLIITHPQTGEMIHTFYGGELIKSLTVLDGGRVVAAGDGMGRVLFLRWVGE